MPLVAKVRFASPLPQLDKEFDYLVPQDLVSSLKFGQLVEVPFGSGAKAKTGVVCGIVDEAAPREKLLTITSLVSSFAVFTRSQLDLCLAVAERQAGTVGELLSGAIPKRFVRAESKLETISSIQELNIKDPSSELVNVLGSSQRLYFQPALLGGSADVPDWAMNFAEASASQLSTGHSTLVVLPDFAEVAKFERALERLGLLSVSLRHSSSDIGSVRYTNHLKSIDSAAINYGLRGASFAPSKDLGLILLWDDGDESHVEQSSPYWSSREVLLQRSELENAQLVISSHSPSTEVVRLVELGYLTHKFASPWNVSVIVTELSDRLDSQTFALISNTLSDGNPVLVQIANAGWASALICVGCKELKLCPSCEASVWIDPSGKMRCRSCKVHIDPTPCVCGKTGTRPTKLGASAFTQQMQRSFPDATVLHSNGDDRLVRVKSGPLLVVATPGSEPEVAGGYSCVVIADAQSMVSSPRLRALEHSIGRWANAISLSRSDATVVFVGLKGDLADDMRKLDFYGSVSDDFVDRQDLGLPPITRIASITSSNDVDHQRLVDAVEAELSSDKVRTLAVVQPRTLVLDYGYSFGVELANSLKSICQKLASSSKSKKPGERVYRINMDDGKVI
ncbi:MAG: hypothetical protein RLZZ606_38 [Actinomycetota bacterium]|jgi:primosomal protein N' (replication factor Y)